MENFCKLEPTIPSREETLQVPVMWEQDSHFLAPIPFPEITLNYILNLDARLIPPQAPAKAPQGMASLIF